VGSALPWTLMGVAVAVVGYLVIAHGAAGPGPLSPAPAQARATGPRPVLMLFTADWCPPCRTLKSNVLSDPSVQTRLQTRYTFETVDLSTRDRASAEVAQSFGVEGIPTLILFDHRGRELARSHGTANPDDFLQWLERSGG
jgi:thiol:disulfide interchange protein